LIDVTRRRIFSCVSKCWQRVHRRLLGLIPPVVENCLPSRDRSYVRSVERLWNGGLLCTNLYCERGKHEKERYDDESQAFHATSFPVTIFGNGMFRRYYIYFLFWAQGEWVEIAKNVSFHYNIEAKVRILKLKPT